MSVVCLFLFFVFLVILLAHADCRPYKLYANIFFSLQKLSLLGLIGTLNFFQGVLLN